MSVLNNLSGKFSLDVFQPPSSYEDIKELKDKSNIEIPNEYIEIIKEKSEIEICVSDESYIRIWGATSCIEMNDAYNIQKYLPNSLAIGDNEGGGVLLYLFGNDGFGLYLCRFADLDINEAIKIAPCLEDFLTRNVGIEKLM